MSRYTHFKQPTGDNKSSGRDSNLSSADEVPSGVSIGDGIKTMHALERVLDQARKMHVIRVASGTGVNHNVCATLETAQQKVRRAMNNEFPEPEKIQRTQITKSDNNSRPEENTKESTSIGFSRR